MSSQDTVGQRRQDARELAIDPGIFETVVALNALGIHTSGSCEGHLDHGTGAPWIDLAAPGLEEEEQVARRRLTEALRRHLRPAEGADVEQPPDELGTAFAVAHDARRAVKAQHLQERARLLALLEIFYAGRGEVPVERRLIVRALDTMGRARLESQGADGQEVAAPEERAERLAAYQQEMAEFTAFLTRQAVCQ